MWVHKNILLRGDSMDFVDGFSSSRKIAEKRMEDIIIRASNKASLTGKDLSDAFIKNGLMGVYNLGMKHMYEYLKGDNNDRKTM